MRKASYIPGMIMIYYTTGLLFKLCWDDDDKNMQEIQREVSAKAVNVTKKKSLLMRLDSLVDHMSTLLPIDHHCAEKFIAEARKVVEVWLLFCHEILVTIHMSPTHTCEILAANCATPAVSPDTWLFVICLCVCSQLKSNKRGLVIHELGQWMISQILLKSPETGRMDQMLKQEKLCNGVFCSSTMVQQHHLSSNVGRPHQVSLLWKHRLKCRIRMDKRLWQWFLCHQYWLASQWKRSDRPFVTCQSLFVSLQWHAQQMEPGHAIHGCTRHLPSEFQLWEM